MSPSERLYRALLRLYPERSRLIWGEDMVQLFRDRLRDAPSPVQRAGVWIDAITDIAVSAPREHLARRPVARVAEGPQPAPPESPRPLRPDLAAASVPLVLAVLVPILMPGYYEPLFGYGVGIMGLPLGIAMLVLSTVLAAIGIFGARRGGVRDPETQLVVLAVLLSPLLLVGAVGLLPFSLAYLIAVLLLAAHFPDHAPAIALAGVSLPLLVLPLASGAAAPFAAYAVVVTLFVLAARIGWLLYALVVPFALVLALGPAVVLIVVNLRG
jgi:hypothetical protein